MSSDFNSLNRYGCWIGLDTWSTRKISQFITNLYLCAQKKKVQIESEETLREYHLKKLLIWPIIPRLFTKTMRLCQTIWIFVKY
jgi:hypothetical protein